MSALTELRIPRLGSVENAKLVAWRVSEGEAFRKGEVLYEIETDKTLTEVEAETDGVVARQVAKEDAELKVGDLVGWAADLGTDAETLTKLVSQLTSTARSTEQRKPQPSAEGGQPASTPPLVRISPRARRLAKEQGVDLSVASSSAHGDRVSGEDVLRFAKKPESTGHGIAGYENVPGEVVINSSRRRAIARRLSESVRTAPHLTADMQIDLTELMSARAARNADLKSAGHPSLSILSYVAHAVTHLLPMHRSLNATFTEAASVLWEPVNLGIAVDTEDGLVVPVIRNAQRKTVEELNSAIAQVAEKARSGAISQDALEGGTFTISNPGSIGPVLRAEAILNPPQVALLGLPGVQYLPVALEANDYKIEVRPVLRASLTFDHRALDGGQVIRFLNVLRDRLERPGAGA